jgi:hypothetical protein
MKSFVRTAAIVGALALPAGTAAAESLGEAGQISIDGAFDLRFTSTSTDADGDESTTLLQIAPALDFFIAPNVSVGGQLLFQYSSGAIDITSVGIAPRVGYVIGLGKLSIWPRAGIGFAYADANDQSVQSLTLNLFAPINYHPVDHFYIGLGPALDLDLYVSDDLAKETSFGVVSVVGGYF